MQPLIWGWKPRCQGKGHITNKTKMGHWNGPFALYFWERPPRRGHWKGTTLWRDKWIYWAIVNPLIPITIRLALATLGHACATLFRENGREKGNIFLRKTFSNVWCDGKAEKQFNLQQIHWRPRTRWCGGECWLGKAVFFFCRKAKVFELLFPASRRCYKNVPLRQAYGPHKAVCKWFDRNMIYKVSSIS